MIGNAAKYVSAIYFAGHDRMGLVMNLTFGSSIQAALLVALLVPCFMRRPMALVFRNPLE